MAKLQKTAAACGGRFRICNTRFNNLPALLVSSSAARATFFSDFSVGPGINRDIGIMPVCADPL
jgi:hypothetical protein